MKYWATKYATTLGIEWLDVTKVFPDGYIRKKDASGYTSQYYKLGRDVFDSYAAARADAEKRVKNRIASLKKQLAKLESITF